MRSRLIRRSSMPRLGVPAYQYPGGDLWRELAALPSESLVVFDPADGPGDSIDPTYVTAISSIRSLGIRVFGYVTTDYGRRRADEMIREVASYSRWYQPTGIFLDQTPAASTSNNAIVATFEHVRSTQMTIAINPGQPDIDPEDVQMSDHVVNFEGPLTTYLDTRFPSWTTEFAPERFWHLVYDVGDFDLLESVLTRAARHRVGMVFVTDATMPNPWGRLPKYWKEELRRLAR
jgi:hypothetical protein